MRLALACALATSTVAASSPQEVELSFRPVEGREVTKTYSSRFAWSLEDIHSVSDGRPSPREFFGNFDLYSVHERELAVVDRYEDVAGDEVQTLVREFTKLRDERTDEYYRADGVQDTTYESSSPFEDRVVRFRARAGEDEGRVVDAELEEEDEHDEDLAPALEGLAFALDLEGLLPQRAVSPGATWDVDEAVFLATLQPCGDLAFALDDPDKADPFRRNRLPGTAVAGRGVAATFEELVKVDGESAARILFTVDLRTRSEEQAEPDSFGGLMGDVQTRTDEIDWSLTGELLWDVERGHFLRYSLDGDIVMTSRTDTKKTFHGRQIESTITVEGSGSYRSVLEVGGC